MGTYGDKFMSALFGSCISAQPRRFLIGDACPPLVCSSGSPRRLACVTSPLGHTQAKRVGHGVGKRDSCRRRACNTGVHPQGTKAMPRRSMRRTGISSSGKTQPAGEERHAIYLNGSTKKEAQCLLLNRSLQENHQARSCVFSPPEGNNGCT